MLTLKGYKINVMMKVIDDKNGISQKGNIKSKINAKPLKRRIRNERIFYQKIKNTIALVGIRIHWY